MRRRRKFNVGGVDVKSGLEERIGRQLLELEIPINYEVQSYQWKEYLPRAFCGNCGTKGCYVWRSYTPDYFLPNGIILEVKGRFTSKDRKIAAAMKEQHPDVDVRMVFDKNDWLNKNHKNRYGDWCDSKGILWCVREIPKDWIK